MLLSSLATLITVESSNSYYAAGWLQSGPMAGAKIIATRS